MPSNNAKQTTKVKIVKHSQYQYTDTPAKQESKLESIIIMVSCIACFAFVGVLLAYRG